MKPQPVLKKVRPFAKRQILWEHGACLLARGHGVCTVARELGVSRTTVWRALKNSRAFQDMVATEYAEMAVEAGGRLQALRDKVSARIERKVEQDDTRVILWLADRLGLVGPHYAKRKLIEQTDPKWFQHDEALHQLTREGMAEQDAGYGNTWRSPAMQAEIDGRLAAESVERPEVIEAEAETLASDAGSVTPVPSSVTPAEAGVQDRGAESLDSRVRGNDGKQSGNDKHEEAAAKMVAEVASNPKAERNQVVVVQPPVSPMVQEDAIEERRLEYPSPFHPRGDFKHDPYIHMPDEAREKIKAVLRARAHENGYPDDYDEHDMNVLVRHAYGQKGGKRRRAAA